MKLLVVGLAAIATACGAADEKPAAVPPAPVLSVTVDSSSDHDDPPLPTRWATSDRDHDAIDDNRDKCPDAPEDRDGFEDDDGCPDPDNDRDGILDVRDKCPNDPETMNGFEDEDGCPDRPQVVVPHPSR